MVRHAGYCGSGLTNSADVKGAPVVVAFVVFVCDVLPAFGFAAHADRTASVDAHVVTRSNRYGRARFCVDMRNPLSRAIG
ncbi:hypothetical protein Raf01_33670 [Rugosimonospora africana]|uniref:Uncharacterized protein n=1 Tax=Rugosimonospora africana TaxID=556532 RepID=A0A8J3QPQ1_9ACTN|nr:hypothetical protein Raf01_33670 [Rugosimonospora africana]